jgi:hypothetical protein
MSRGLKLFLEKHEKSKVKHNGKVPLKLGKCCYQQEKRKWTEKRI